MNNKKKLNHFCHQACVTTINVNNHGIDFPFLSTVFYVSANQPFPDLQPAVVQSFSPQMQRWRGATTLPLLCLAARAYVLQDLSGAVTFV